MTQLIRYFTVGIMGPVDPPEKTVLIGIDLLGANLHKGVQMSNRTDVQYGCLSDGTQLLFMKSLKKTAQNSKWFGLRV